MSGRHLSALTLRHAHIWCATDYNKIIGVCKKKKAFRPPWLARTGRAGQCLRISSGLPGGLVDPHKKWGSWWGTSRSWAVLLQSKTCGMCRTWSRSKHDGFVFSWTGMGFGVRFIIMPQTKNRSSMTCFLLRENYLFNTGKNFTQLLDLFRSLRSLSSLSVYTLKNEYNFPSALDRGTEIDRLSQSKLLLRRVFTWINPRTASATRALLRLTPCYWVHCSPR